MAAFDVVVLGGGTAGVHVATEVAGGGKTVALVEAGLIGGESAYLACLPSNSLLLSASRGEPWEDAVARRAEVTGGLDDSAAAQRLNRAGVQVIRGTGRITAPDTIEVTRAQGAPAAAGGTGSRAAGGTGSGTTTLTYSDLVIATGSRPAVPAIAGLADVDYWTSRDAIWASAIPTSLVVLGGGAVGAHGRGRARSRALRNPAVRSAEIHIQ